MPLLAGLLGSIFTGIMTFFIALVGKKIALVLALITASVAAFGVLYSGATAALGAISQTVPAFVAIPASWILPGNIAACLSARLSVSVALFAYRWHRDTIMMASSA